MNAVGFCQHGCEQKPVYSGICIDCRKEFSTGRFSQDQCRSCELKENARHVREASGDSVSHTGYGADMRKVAINKHAMAQRDPAEVERERERLRGVIQETRSA
jgi:hypothetical protein